LQSKRLYPFLPVMGLRPNRGKGAKTNIMKKLYKKLRMIENKIAEAKNDFYSFSEEKQKEQMLKYAHWFDELAESRLTVLFDIKSFTENEIRKHSDNEALQSA